jgi:putative glutamine amidotransferase
MSERPLIGVVSYGKAKNPNRYTLPIAYVDSVRRAGGRILIIPPGDPDNRDYLDILDGFILAGGGDINAAHFGQEPHPKLSEVDAERDAAELDLAVAITQRRMPLLAICRGVQVLNVALGGDLIQHLEPGPVRHTQGTGEIVLHTVQVADDSLLAQIGGKGVWEVGSKHHQAVGRLGRGLEPVAWSADGVVEAVEHHEYPDLLGVQWHPEETADKDPRQQSLFDWLVSRAAAKD